MVHNMPLGAYHATWCGMVHIMSHGVVLVHIMPHGMVWCISCRMGWYSAYYTTGCGMVHIMPHNNNKVHFALQPYRLNTILFPIEVHCLIEVHPVFQITHEKN